MSITLTRKRVSALAKLDFSGKSHCQRVDMIAAALGAKNQASLMATLKIQEKEMPAPVPGMVDNTVFLRRFLALRRMVWKDEPYYVLTINKWIVGRDDENFHTNVSSVSNKAASFLIESGLGVFRENENGHLEPTGCRADHGLVLRAAPDGGAFLHHGEWSLCRVDASNLKDFLEISGVPLWEPPAFLN